MRPMRHYLLSLSHLTRLVYVSTYLSIFFGDDTVDHDDVLIILFVWSRRIAQSEYYDTVEYGLFFCFALRFLVCLVHFPTIFPSVCCVDQSSPFV
jgi:hypothetical protein